jgi:ribosomal protein S12
MWGVRWKVIKVNGISLEQLRTGKKKKGGGAAGGK